MTPETITALRASIAHHEKNLEAETPAEVKLGWKHCALCGLFNRPDTGECDRCVGCPVAEYAGNGGCCGTPFEGVNDALCEWRNTERSTFISAKSTFRTADRAEIEFLKSLLPEEHV